MADPKPSSPNGVVTLSAAEINALADRLAARGASLIFRDAPEVASDMRVGARVIRKLVGELRAQHTRMTELLLGLTLD
jgi:hypothetical protein